MINEKELRTGNLYATIRNQEIVVKGIDTVNKFVIIDPVDVELEITSRNEGSIIFEDLHPIELTEPKLLEFGFVKQDSIALEVISDKGAKFLWDETNNQIVLQDCENGIIGQAIKYLHQFQNIYSCRKFTGIEVGAMKALGQMTVHQYSDLLARYVIYG